MLYSILKAIAWVALRVFFKSLKVQHRERLPRQGPLVVVANHPNTFMDPIVIAAQLRPQMYFLAMASVFNSPFTRWLFTRLHMIPVQRKQDSNQQKFDNKEIFQKCYEHLGRGGCILIFPEGTSVHGRVLHELKTGAARIALGAEEMHGWSLGVQIVTIGLNYSKPDSFRSEVLVNVDEPIAVREYQTQYEQDAIATAARLTEQIRANLEEMVVVADTQAQDLLAKQIEQIYKPQLNEEIQLSAEEKEQDFLMSRGILEAVRHFEQYDPARLTAFQARLARYLRHLERLNLNDEVFAKRSLGRNLLSESLYTALYFITGFPIFVYSIVNNYVPYIIPSQVAAWLARKVGFYEYTAPVMMLTGIFTFTFFYLLQVSLCYYLTQSWLWALLYFVSLPITGFFGLFYANYLTNTRDKWRVFSLFFRRTDLISSLVAERKLLIAELESAKQAYLAYHTRDII